MVKLISVLGMGRSGTSMVTKYLGSCGVRLGNTNWAFEHIEVRKINDPIISDYFGGSIGSLPYGRRKESVEFEVSLQEKVDTFVSQFKAEDLEKEFCAIKDPRCTLLPSLWAKHYDIIIGIFRNPEEVIESYIGHKFINHEESRRVLEEYYCWFNSELLKLAGDNFYLLKFDNSIDIKLEQLSRKLNLPKVGAPIFEQDKKHYSSPQTKESLTFDIYEELKRHEFKG